MQRARAASPRSPLTPTVRQRSDIRGLLNVNDFLRRLSKALLSVPKAAAEALTVEHTEDASSDGVTAVHLLSQVLLEAGYPVEIGETTLLHCESGFSFQPHFVTSEALSDGGYRTVSAIEARHPVLPIGGVFEYQHAAAKTASAAFVSGFESWLQTDLVVFLDALLPQPKHCTFWEMDVPATTAHPVRHRRAVLGPVAHFIASGLHATGAYVDGQHAFCPCCLLTRSGDAFKPLIQDTDTAAIRLFAAREADGTPLADCRVNGEEYPEGAEALRHYATTWPATASYEFRKQYVLLIDRSNVA